MELSHGSLWHLGLPLRLSMPLENILEESGIFYECWSVIQLTLELAPGDLFTS